MDNKNTIDYGKVIDLFYPSAHDFDEDAVRLLAKFIQYYDVPQSEIVIFCDNCNSKKDEVASPISICCDHPAFNKESMALLDRSEENRISVFAQNTDDTLGFDANRIFMINTSKISVDFLTDICVPVINQGTTELLLVQYTKQRGMRITGILSGAKYLIMDYTKDLKENSVFVKKYISEIYEDCRTIKKLFSGVTTDFDDSAVLLLSKFISCYDVSERFEIVIFCDNCNYKKDVPLSTMMIHCDHPAFNKENMPFFHRRKESPIIVFPHYSDTVSGLHAEIIFIINPSNISEDLFKQTCIPVITQGNTVLLLVEYEREKGIRITEVRSDGKYLIMDYTKSITSKSLLKEKRICKIFEDQ